MTLKEAYESVESNYDNVLKRLGSEGMIKRFAVKFIDDPTFGELKNALAAGDGESAFRGNDEWRCSIFYCFYFKQKAGPHL